MLLAARGAWVAVAALALVVVVASAPALFVQYTSLCVEAASVCLEGPSLTAEVARVFAEAGISVRAYALVMVAVDVLTRMVWFFVGAVIFLRRSDDRMALVVAFFLVSFGTATFASDGVDALVAVSPAWSVPGRALQIIGEVGAVLFFLTFPNGRFEPRWTVGIAAAFLIFQVPSYFDPDIYARLLIPEGASGLVFMGLVLSMVGSQIYRYRKVSDARQRRQTKLVVGGAATAICVLFAVLAPLWLLAPSLAEVSPFVLAAVGAFVPFVMLLVPLSIGVAVLRSGLFDIDVVINRALVYGTLSLSLAGTYIGSVIALQHVLRALTGQTSQFAVVVSTLAVAAMFVPLRRRIHSFIDRRFYREKYDARRVLEAFSARLRSETELETLSDDLVSVARDTVRPAHVSLWLKPSAENREGVGS